MKMTALLLKVSLFIMLISPAIALGVETKTGSLFGGSSLTNPNITLIVSIYGYGSNLRDSELETWGIPGYTTEGSERRKGFHSGAAELGIFAPVDPYFNLYTNIPITEEGIEVEEAYVVTTSLPEGFQAKIGRFKSNFSRLDSLHPHAWDFADLPLVYRAFLGAEGLGGEDGVQLTWLPALPIYAQFGMELLQGANPLLFGEGASSSPHALAAFLKISIDTGDNTTLYFGPSILAGKTRSELIYEGDEFRGDSVLGELEAVLKIRTGDKTGVVLQGEYFLLSQLGELEAGGRAVREQDGYYVQGVYQRGRMRYGLRYDQLEAAFDKVRIAGVESDNGTSPRRTSACVEFKPSEFSKIRFQYSHDLSARDGRANDEGMVELIFGVGAHAAHAF